MKFLVTGSAGHLGEALMRIIRQSDDDALGLDLLQSTYTDVCGSITDRGLVRECVTGVDAIIHTATLHKPHIATHTRQQFVDTNITGTLNLLEAAVEAGVSRFIFTSTTSAFGLALIPPANAPAAWITEEITPVPKNIYGVSKTAAEDLCQLFHRLHGLPILVLRTSRFFPEEDDNKQLRAQYADPNLKVNELLHRRVDVEDAATAHICAVERALSIGFAKYIISATSPFREDDLPELRLDAPNVVRRRVPGYQEIYDHLNWRVFKSIDRVYVNEKARRELGWNPKYDFAHALSRLRAGEPVGSELARTVGAKGYHETEFSEGPYPVE
jgi:UDP-glucose 4-epimerase